PLGVRILYEGLQQCCGLSVERSYVPFGKVKERSHSVYLDLGDAPSGLFYLPQSAIDELEAYIRGDGRLVISFVPMSEKKIDRTLMNFVEDKKVVDLTKEWDFDFYTYPLSEKMAEPVQNALHLPRFVCHTILYFIDLSHAWQIIYERAGHAVMIERKMGKGSIVLSADSYFLSNEAMSKERHPELIAWL